MNPHFLCPCSESDVSVILYILHSCDKGVVAPNLKKSFKRLEDLIMGNRTVLANVRVGKDGEVDSKAQEEKGRGRE